jgi:hypothetical protein
MKDITKIIIATSAALLLCTAITVAFILPTGYRHEAIQLCNIAIVDRTRCETDIDGLHAQIGESYRSLRHLEKVLRFFADRAAKKWPLRGSLKLG